MKERVQKNHAMGDLLSNPREHIYCFFQIVCAVLGVKREREQ
jgi:hypothetical protein